MPPVSFKKSRTWYLSLDNECEVAQLALLCVCSFSNRCLFVSDKENVISLSLAVYGAPAAWTHNVFPYRLCQQHGTATRKEGVAHKQQGMYEGEDDEVLEFQVIVCAFRHGGCMFLTCIFFCPLSMHELLVISRTLCRFAIDFY